MNDYLYRPIVYSDSNTAVNIQLGNITCNLLGGCNSSHTTRIGRIDMEKGGPDDHKIHQFEEINQFEEIH